MEHKKLLSTIDIGLHFKLNMAFLMHFHMFLNFKYLATYKITSILTLSNFCYLEITKHVSFLYKHLLIEKATDQRRQDEKEQKSGENIYKYNTEK